MKNRNTRFRVALVASSLVLALGLSEAISRLVTSPHQNLRFEQDISELERGQLHAATQVIETHNDLFWQLAPNKKLTTDSWPFFGIMSNSQSLREDHRIPLQKKPDDLTILFIGDSCTFGYGVAYDESFVEVAESLIQSMLPDKTVECINAGVPGYSLFQGSRYLATKGLNYQPDLVVLNFGWNDYARWDDRSDMQHDALIQAITPPAPLDRSRLCQLIWQAKAGNPSPDEQTSTPNPQKTQSRPRLLPDEFTALLESTKSLTTERGIAMLVLVWPMRGNADHATPGKTRPELQNRMIAFGKAHSLSASSTARGSLDLTPLARQLTKEHGVQKIYIDKGHVTAMAHDAIAREIVHTLTPWIQTQKP